MNFNWKLAILQNKFLGQSVEEVKGDYVLTKPICWGIPTGDDDDDDNVENKELEVKSDCLLTNARPAPPPCLTDHQRHPIQTLMYKPPLHLPLQPTLISVPSYTPKP